MKVSRTSALNLGLATALSGVLSGITSLAREPHHMGRTRRPAGWRNVGGVPANINRHTGRPHEHKREIARRLRQQERVGK